MSDSTPCTPGSNRLTQPDEMLYRQVHPQWVRDGELKPPAFTPGSGDDGLLSVSRSSLIGAEASWQRHTQIKGLSSAGVWGVTVTEAERPCLADPTVEPPDDAHAVIDFRGLSRGQREAVAKRLKTAAQRRGCLYAPALPPA